MQIGDRYRSVQIFTSHSHYPYHSYQAAQPKERKIGHIRWILLLIEHHLSNDRSQWALNENFIESMAVSHSSSSILDSKSQHFGKADWKLLNFFSSFFIEPHWNPLLQFHHNSAVGVLSQLENSKENFDHLLAQLFKQPASLKKGPKSSVIIIFLKIVKENNKNLLSIYNR